MPEAKPQIISQPEGEALAAAYLASMQKCFGANDFSSQYDMWADQVSWEWSGDVIGEGSKAEFFEVVGGSWQMMVSQWLPTSPSCVVDTEQGIICITFDAVLIMDGRGKVPITPVATVTGRNMFEIHLNADQKITKFRGIWNPQNKDLMAAMGAVLAA